MESFTDVDKGLDQRQWLNFTNSAQSVNSKKLHCFCGFSNMLLFIKRTSFFKFCTLRQVGEIELR